MNEDVKALWVEKLQSGDIPQAYELLVTLDSESGEVVGMCCLGVLCTLAVEAGVQVNVTEDDFEFGLCREFDSHATCLPDSVAEWAGLDDADPRVSDRATDEIFELSKFNDGRDGGAYYRRGEPIRRRSFPEIAALIDASL